jgi:hypothetical protein
MEADMSGDEYDLAPDPARASGRSAQHTSTATTTVKDATGGFVRDGMLVVRDGAVLPDRCIRCNAPAASGRRSKRWAYNVSDEGQPLGRLIPIIGVFFRIAWLVGRFNTRQHLTVSFCVCKRHQTMRMLWFAVMSIGMAAGVAMLGIAIAQDRGALAIAGIWVFFCGALAGWGTNLLQIAVPMANGALLKGAGKPFLSSMPRLRR